MRRHLLLLALVGLVGACGTSAATGTDPTFPSHKVFVCKYVGTPGLDERLQTGDNPISVDISSLANFVAIGDFFNDEQGRSVAIAFDTGQPEPDVSECPQPSHPTTTTTKHETTTTTTMPTTTSGPTTTTPTPGQFSINVFSICPDGVPLVSITFGNRPDLNGQTGTLTDSTGGSQPLTFIAGATVQIPYPDTTDEVTLVYTLGTETASATVGFPENCESTTTSTTVPGGTTTTSTIPGDTTTTTIPDETTTTATTVPGAPFAFGAAASVCVREVPTIRIVFQNRFPELAGETGTLTMSDLDGNVVSRQPLVYEPGTTVDLLYPGTRINPDGTVADVPGWILNDDGLWVRDPSDDHLRDGIDLTYTVNPTATARVTYPPESSACANPENPPPTTTTTPSPPTLPPVTTISGLPVTR